MYPAQISENQSKETILEEEGVERFTYRGAKMRITSNFPEIMQANREEVKYLKC